MLVTALESTIRRILCAPGTDLNTISAKRVRKQLLELEPSITDDWVKANKDQIDTLIAGVFEAVSSADARHAGVSSDAGVSKRKREYDAADVYDDDAGDNDDEHYDEDGGPSSPLPKPKKSKSKREISDAELARQLSSQLNGSNRSSRSSANGKPKVKKTSGKAMKKTKKSAERVTDSDDESNVGSDGEKKRKKRKSNGSGGGAKGGFQKEFILSEPLAAVLDIDRLSRPQVVKQLWAYIKGNDLQNPLNKREIMCDDQLRAVFNTDKIDMFKMNKVLGQHLHEEE